MSNFALNHGFGGGKSRVWIWRTFTNLLSHHIICHIYIILGTLHLKHQASRSTNKTSSNLRGFTCNKQTLHLTYTNSYKIPKLRWQKDLTALFFHQDHPPWFWCLAPKRSLPAALGAKLAGWPFYSRLLMMMMMRMMMMTWVLCVFHDWLIRFETFALSVVLGSVEIQVYHHTFSLKIKKQPGSVSEKIISKFQWMLQLFM